METQKYNPGQSVVVLKTGHAAVVRAYDVPSATYQIANLVSGEINKVLESELVYQADYSPSSNQSHQDQV